MENSSEFYYSKLKSHEKPGVWLATFYCQLYNIDITRSEIMLFNRLLKMFDRFLIFNSIMDMFGSKPERIEDPYSYLFAICQRRFETVYTDSTLQSRRSLDKYIEAIDEEIERNKKVKLKIPPSKGLE